MEVLMTGCYGRVGTALIDHLYDRTEYDFRLLNRSDRPDDHPYGEYETVVADVADYEPLHDALEGTDAIVHLAAYPYTDGDWEDVLEPNVIGMYNVLQACREQEVESVVFGSTHHVMGMYELEKVPEIYSPEFGLVLDHTDPVRPDSFYASTKVFGEALGRFYVENYEYPKRFYSLRIGSVREAEYDNPYGDVMSGFDVDASVDHDQEEDQIAERKVNRMKGVWQSRRDCAHMVDRCLQDDDVEFDIFYGVSDNRRRWFDLEHARAVIGYNPQDDGEEWTEPPE